MQGIGHLCAPMFCTHTHGIKCTVGTKQIFICPASWIRNAGAKRHGCTLVHARSVALGMRLSTLLVCLKLARTTATMGQILSLRILCLRRDSLIHCLPLRGCMRAVCKRRPAQPYSVAATSTNVKGDSVGSNMTPALSPPVTALIAHTAQQCLNPRCA
jgi:hypothetical protein